MLAEKYLLEDKDIAFIYLVFFHYNGIISDGKFKGMLKTLRPIDPKALKLDIPLLRKVGTYHNTINDKWYNDESMIDILEDTFTDLKHKIVKKEMPLEEFLKYINLLTNKNKNFCVDYFYFQIVERMLRQYVANFENYDGTGFRCLHSLNSAYDFESKRLEWVKFKPTGYCCEDCDGDYETYKRSQFSAEIGCKLFSSLEKHFQNALGFYKSEDRFKNPNCKF